MKARNAFPFLLLLAAGLIGCSSGTDEVGQTRDGSQTEPPIAGESNGPTDSAPSGAVGGIVVYTANDSSLNAVRADGQQRTGIASNAVYQGATEDGWVIFVQGHQLGSVRPADGARRILDDTPGSKHFRGIFATNYVVYEVRDSARNETSVRVVRADGSGRLVPVPPQPRSVEFIAVTPTLRILYQVCDPVNQDGSPDCINQRLLSSKLDGGDERLVLSGAPLIRHITADDQLVYDRDTPSGTAVSIVKSDGTGDRVLDDANSFFAGALPNGRIVYNRQLNGQLDLYSVAANATSPRALATSAEDEIYAGTTPDGRVLFLRGAPAQRRLYSVDESTGDIRAMQVSGDSRVRAIAPNGAVIVSTRFGAPGEEEDNLYSIRADGSELRALADSSDMEWFEGLAPDGRVVYMRCVPAPFGPCSHPSAQSDLYSVSLNGTGTVALAASGAFEVAQAVTQDNLVIFRFLRDDQSDLYSIPTAGGPAQPLADTTSDEQFLTVIERGPAGENPG